MPRPLCHDAEVFRDLVHARLRATPTVCCDDARGSVASKYVRRRFGSLDAFFASGGASSGERAAPPRDGFVRLGKLRDALAALDRGGWERSYHQRVFHESFLNAVVRILFKTDPPGHFTQSYPRLLELNGWSSISQEILVSTPRRFGKTIAVCLFVAALLYACPSIEISIYSTCKRISQKLLRNCMRFVEIVYTVLGEDAPAFTKQTTDEVEIQGSEGRGDFRRLNSYPSKVDTLPRAPHGLYNAHSTRALPTYGSRCPPAACACACACARAAPRGGGSPGVRHGARRYVPRRQRLLPARAVQPHARRPQRDRVARVPLCRLLSHGVPRLSRL